MIANYGYTDASGTYLISIDTDRCDGCGQCVRVCPGGILELREEDPYDPFREIPVAAVVESESRRVKYACGTCKPVTDRPPLPCVEACKPGAISHSW